MACRVDITVGLAGKDMLEYVDFDVSLGYIFDRVAAQFEPEWMAEYRMVIHDESYTRSRAEAMAISDVTQNASVRVLFVPTANMEHTTKRGRESKEFEMFASKVAPSAVSSPAAQLCSWRPLAPFVRVAARCRDPRRKDSSDDGDAV